MSKTAPFYIVNAFSDKLSGGNPALIVFVPSDTPYETLQNIANTFHQPMAAFLLGDPVINQDQNGVKSAQYDITYILPTKEEVALCGHATLAAARAIFETNDLISKGIDVLHFRTKTRGIATAKLLDGGYIEMSLPSGIVSKIEGEEERKLTQIIHGAFGKPVDIKFLGKGGPGFEIYVLIEVGEDASLGTCKVKAVELLDSGYDTHVIASLPPQGSKASFVSRMFAPRVLPVYQSEDQVCGSAHSLLTPYYSEKLSIASGKEFIAEQASTRGGTLHVIWDKEKGVVILRGLSKVVCKSDLFL